MGVSHCGVTYKSKINFQCFQTLMTTPNIVLFVYVDFLRKLGIFDFTEEKLFCFHLISSYNGKHTHWAYPTFIMCSCTQVHSWLPNMDRSSSSEMKKKRGKAFLFESR